MKKLTKKLTSKMNKKMLATVNDFELHGITFDRVPYTVIICGTPIDVFDSPVCQVIIENANARVIVLPGGNNPARLEDLATAKKLEELLINLGGN